MQAEQNGLLRRGAGRDVRPFSLLPEHQCQDIYHGQIHPASGDLAGEICGALDEDGGSLLAGAEGQYSGEPVDVPQNHKRAVCDLTVADRLALYDHVVAVFKQQKEAASSGNEDLYVDLVSKLQKDEEQNQPKTHLELMAEMRDYKRRRQSYRAKNVHITKKSYTEVIREVISVHSEELARQWRDEANDHEAARAQRSSSRRDADERRSASTESRHSHGKRHRSRERSYDRENKKKKKKKERDSHSPDDHHHHDRKKKKKRRKEEREEREKDK